MKRLGILMVLCFSFLLAGCTLVDSPHQRARRQVLTVDLQSRALLEDWDYLWLMERNTYLTQWHPRVGY